MTSPVSSAAGDCAVGPWPAGIPDGSIEFAEYQIIDLAMSKPGEQMPWGSVLAPADWTASQGMRWSQRTTCARNAQNDRWTIETPDGSARISLLPPEAWKIPNRFSGGSTASSCEARTDGGAELFLMDLAKRLENSARGFTSRDRLDILATRSPEDAQRARYENFEIGISAAELSFTFTSGAGPRDALLVSIVTITESAPGIPERDVHGSSAVSLLASFPAGGIDQRLVETIRRSGFANSNWHWKQWQQRMRDMKLATMDDTLKAAMAERTNDVRPVGKAHSFAGRTFTTTGVPDLWRDSGGRYFLFPAGAVPAVCTVN